MEKTISHEIYKLLEKAKAIASVYPYKSFEISKEAYNISRKNNLKDLEGYSLISMSFACRAKTEINEMLNYSFKAFEIFEDTNEIAGKIKSLNLIGIAYFYSSMYEEALKYFLQVVDLTDQQKDDFLLSCVLNNIGEVYRESSSYNKALEYFFRTLELCEKNEFIKNSAAILGNIGEVYFRENKFDEALEFYIKSYKILAEENDMVCLGDLENRLGKIYYITGNRNKAEEYYFCALNRLEEIGNKYYAIDVMMNISELLATKDSKKSLYYCEKAIQYAEKINAKKKLCEVYKVVSEYYENAGDFKVSLEYYKKYAHINEEIMASSLGNKLEILNIELMHDKKTDKYEKIKDRLEKEISNQKKEFEKIKKANEVLEKKAFEDELTAVPNRRCINNRLTKTFEESQVNDDVIALFMMDIDYFKKYNDYWGHSKGDECIKKIANCISNIQLKRRDTFGRYGGEEFVYFTKFLNYDQALELGNLIRYEVEKLDLYYMDEGRRMTVTISIGGALGKVSDLICVSNILQLADEELYNAKSTGRNTTVIKYVN